MLPSSSAFLRFSSRWSWITLANSDGVSTVIVSVSRWVVRVRRGILTWLLAGGGRDGPRSRRRHAVLTGPFGVVERAVRRSDELVLRAEFGERRDAEARGDTDPRAVGGVDLLARQLASNALRDLAGALEVGARQQQGELLAPPTAGEVDLADARVERGGEDLQHVVAGGVSPAVIDPLEVVDVREHDRERLAEALGTREFLLERGGAEPAIRQAGEPVHQGLLLDRLVAVGVRERDHGMADEPAGALPLLRGELVAVEELSERRTGGVDGGLDDHAEELIDVVARGERLPEPQDGLTDSAARL